MFLFTPNNTFFLKDIPEGLTLRGRDTIVDILQTIKGNSTHVSISDLSTIVLVFRLSELIKDARGDERDALSKMSAEAKDLHRKLLKALADLRVKETYHVGAHALYRILEKEPNRELVGDNEPLYGMIFSPKGLLQLPSGINPHRPFAAGGFNIDSGLAGYKLYDIILKTLPRWVRIKRNDSTC